MKREVNQTKTTQRIWCCCSTLAINACLSCLSKLWNCLEYTTRWIFCLQELFNGASGVDGQLARPKHFGNANINCTQRSEVTNTLQFERESETFGTSLVLFKKKSAIRKVVTAEKEFWFPKWWETVSRPIGSLFWSKERPISHQPREMMEEGEIVQSSGTISSTESQFTVLYCFMYIL